MLHQKREIEEAVWSNPQIEQFRSSDEDPGLAVTLHDLVKTLQAVLERAKQRPVYEVGGEDVSVPDMIRFLRGVFADESKPVPARELFERQRSRRGMICLFLAMLELVKLQALGLVQQDAFGEIGIKRLKGFDAAFNSEQIMSTIDEGYN
jgi:segregation and condensation protein A